ncbi:MAG TPA: SDR family NAD(P)-dependent oxidoreductase, partial [Gemmatimonadales bacterium]|nr:SDR family NAD(P)-dependent oxidoreductase [Gemmatimonadales bacterium]
STVVAGAHEELADLIGTLERTGVFCRAVNVDVPAHGPDALPLAVELRESLADLDPAPPSIEFLSTVAFTEGVAPRLDAEYWAGNLTEPVRFAAAVSRLLDAGCDTFVEIGPHPVLQSSIQQSMVQRGIEGTVVPSLLRDEDGVATMLRGFGALYASGRSPEWEVVAPVRGRVLSLPTYPWQRERFWLETSINGHEPVADRPEAVHPLLGRPIPLAAEPQIRLWQTGPAELADAFLLDHRLDDRTVVPAAAYLEMALAAAAEAGMATGHELVELSLPLLLELPSSEQPTLQTRLAPDSDGTAAFTVHARRPGSDEWRLHASARLRPSDGELHSPASLPPAALRARCPEPVAPDALYRMLASRGLRYGPRMRAVVEAWRGPGEALGRIVLPEAIRHGAGRFHLHPVLLDAALQTVAAAVGPAEAANGDAFVPAGCRSVRLCRTPANGLWSHVILRQDGSDRSDSGEIRADVRLVDDRGGCIAELADVRFIRRPRHRSEPVRERDTWFYRVEWQPAASSEPAASNESDARDWVVIGHPGPLAEGLRSRLEAAGHRCRVLPAAWPADALSRDGLREMLRAGTAPLRGIVYLGPSGSPAAADGDSPAVVATRGTAAALALVQAVAECGAALGTPRLWLVTRGAQQVLSDHPVILDDAALWGLGKSVALELPELRSTLLDLDPAIGGGDAAERVAAELLQADAEGEVALRGHARLVARLLPDPGPVAAPACGGGTDGPALRPDATYLITGGLGGLGLTVAAWMVERGAEHLVLAGRSGASPAAEAEMARLAAAGARVELARVDVTRPDQVAEMLRRIRTTMPPLEGVIHAAGVLENAAVANLDPDRLARVLAPKVAGAWHLHEATREDPLRFFVLFSSAVSVLGSPGQGNYAAANAFLDALGRYRRARGLPASSINWGPWAEVGLVADSGLKGIRPARGCEVLDWVLRTEPAQVAVLPFDLATLLELYPAAARIPLFAEVGGRETHVSRLYARPQLRQAYIAPRNDVERRLAELWRQTLRIDRVGVRDSFFELGGDSVLAAQIVASTHRTFGVEIDMREAFRSFTIESLAERVEAALVARLDELTDAEVDRLLQE